MSETKEAVRADDDEQHRLKTKQENSVETAQQEENPEDYLVAGLKRLARLGIEATVSSRSWTPTALMCVEAALATLTRCIAGRWLKKQPGMVIR